MKRTIPFSLLLLLAPLALAASRPLNSVVQDFNSVPANVFMPLSGIGTMIAESLPPKITANGTDAQAAAVTATVDSTITRGLLPAPSPSCGKVTNCYLLSDYYNFALLFARAKNSYHDMEPTSPLLFLLRYRLVIYTDPTTHVIDWAGVDKSIAELLTIMLAPDAGGNVEFKLGPNTTAAQVIGFAQDLARIVDTYDRS